MRSRRYPAEVLTQREILRLRSAALRIAARGSDATQTPQLKPRRADCAARESVGVLRLRSG